MTKKYIKPYLNRHGNSTEVVKGSCGIGIENWSLDQTGARRARFRRWVAIGTMPACCGQIGIVTIRQCQVIEVCATGNEC